ncbi:MULTISPECIES: NADPH-dependent 7-cyano-7-deazaguanine reductase QueF [unclassified Psychrobacter]|uniref:NADPH-dependent 7-cyano-7-deazaguanine reductase QueF n=1 Tax=unclassified Psychrobacter TaxID=196806 RepID=UPI00086C2207|nr:MULTISPECIES: NADPH-dependent 7-cyano-7-deazaguanine reductase QueF [unclassified Psychrobacter]MBA6243520.1 NADPH-dependent 7-cyano-7-deazaguanine reductase QueF [Psychrobacter sp. Urea-trap-18]MBA6286126.1 NADPH-dependent 7-cyano-7-deazaguanine reductase QueF [Psychrobacter sp. Urea-trap-16]MBA6317231.1 NADPH-dependent 7-cyano-7-deazaguanine reductase QueF [Psychrobacter sp. Urea-trap-20]MBA6334325.1 NADPH-dependent 7-cyano-7-deazaguanine reductase QueF [Psychrobacter sp. Urea-trap-19]OEH|tara:strand:+ start:25508 stop:26395 length:888 start_codon:yes stop_codon:yes gene_type:complete
MSIHGILGEQTTDYPTEYSPETLYPIARSMGRNAIGWQDDKLTVGVDWWQAFEISWLNPQGISQVAIARFSIPASSPSIVESKSLKLYLNSINFTEFASWNDVQALIAKDLSACLQADVQVALFGLNDDLNGNETELLIAQPEGVCIDEALAGNTDKVALTEHPDASLLSASEEIEASSRSVANEGMQPYTFYSNLLRSNCPVTNQPDWGTLAVSITTDKPFNNASMLRYILSFRQHNGFHEQCVEQIFADLSQYYQPSELMVRAWYTRRGGIDINPCRVSDISLLPKPSRLIRQ